MCMCARSCPTLCNPMDCRIPGSSLHGILQAKILEWVAFSFSRRSSQPRDRTWVSCMTGRFSTVWASRGAWNKDTPLLLRLNEVMRMEPWSGRTRVLMREDLEEFTFSLHYVRTQQTRKRVLTRNWTGQPLTLRLLSLQNCEKINFCCLNH